MNKILFFLSILLSFNIVASPTLVSHKGAWRDMELPQNTRESIVKALSSGFSAIEFDIYMTLDQVFILAHDDGLEKVTNCKGKISQKKYDAIKDCLVIKNTLLPITKVLLKKVKNPKKLVRLDEILNILNQSDSLDLVWIDLKEKDEGLINPLIQTIEFSANSNLKSSIVINNTSPSLLLKFKDVYPEIRYSLEGKWGSEPLVDDSYLKNAGRTHDVISLNVGFRLGDESVFKIINKRKRFYKRLGILLQKAKDRNIPVIGWTVNKLSKIEKLLSTELDYLLTDRSLPLSSSR